MRDTATFNFTPALCLVRSYCKKNKTSLYIPGNDSCRGKIKPAIRFFTGNFILNQTFNREICTSDL